VASFFLYFWEGNINYELCKRTRAESWTLRKVDQKYQESFEKWFWRRMKKITSTDRVRNEEVAQTLEGRNTLQTIKRRKAN
jgi:hypothetical protein